jgi:putative ABC transport system permease protein
LLIACANLANLFAARGASRGREFAIRAAVGARRSQIVSQLLIESFVVALLGGALGVCVAVWARDALIALSPSDVARFHRIEFDWPVWAFALVIAGLTTLVFGLWPAWQTSHADVQLALKSGSQGAGDAPAAKRTRDWLVIAEIALTLTLLTGAALVLKSFSRMQALRLGYEPRGLLTMRMDLPFRVYSTREKTTAFTTTLLEQVRALPGVESAGIGSNSPLMGGWQTGFAREGAPPSLNNDMPSANLEVVTGDYFVTFKAPLLRGRLFNATDTTTSPRVVVIDQALAEQFFPGEDPIGKRLNVDVGNDDEGYAMAEIIGVVGRMRFHAIEEMSPLPVIYCSMTQAYRSGLILFVRDRGAIAALERFVRDIVRSIDPAQPIYDVRSMEERVQESWGAQRLLSFLISIFAGLSLVLATVGLYGVLSYSTARRFREFGLRFALGATPNDVRKLIFGHGFRLFAAGCIVGLIAALACNRTLHSFLFQVSPAEPVLYAVVALILAVVTAIACWLPAARAARIEPAIVLRAE